MGNENLDFYPSADEFGPQPGPSWQRAGWPLAGGAEDDLTQALDPLAIKAAIKQTGVKGLAPALDDKALEAAASDTIRAVMLIRTYRVTNLEYF